MFFLSKISQRFFISVTVALVFWGGSSIETLAQSTQPVTCAAGDVLTIYCEENGTRKEISDPTKCTNGTVVYECLYGSEVVPSAFGGQVTDIRNNVRIALNIGLGFVGVIVVIMIVYGGVLWTTAAGNEDKVKSGKHTIMWAAIGGVVISIAWSIASYILQIGRALGD